MSEKGSFSDRRRGKRRGEMQQTKLGEREGKGREMGRGNDFISRLAKLRNDQGNKTKSAPKRASKSASRGFGITLISVSGSMTISIPFWKVLMQEAGPN